MTDSSPDSVPAEWTDAEVSADDAQIFIKSGVAVDVAREWINAGIEAGDAIEYLDFGVPLDQAVDFVERGIAMHQITRTDTGFEVKLEPWQEDPVDQLPKVIEPGRIHLTLWTPDPWHDEPLECSVTLHWDGKCTVQWSVVSGIGMSMMSEVCISGIAGWPDGSNVELCYTNGSGEHDVDTLSKHAPTANDPQQWVLLAQSLVSVSEELLDSGFETDDRLTDEYFNAGDALLTFEDMFGDYLASAKPNESLPDFWDWLDNAVDAGTYRRESSNS